MKKTILCILVLCALISLGGFNKQNLKAEPQIYYEYNRVLPTENKIEKTVYTNEQTKKDDLLNQGFTHNESDDTYIKVEEVGEVKTINTSNMYNKMEEIFELQNSILQKTHEMFNDFFIKDTNSTTTQNLENEKVSAITIQESEENKNENETVNAQEENKNELENQTSKETTLNSLNKNETNKTLEENEVVTKKEAKIS